ncbi:MAG: serine/threonine protein kinase [Gallionellaceae bacterium CG02_land_8_20_14_3_00_60_115]|nr:MAG: serine/threonine protein kinase [Gallionellaceae bacterium CG02_land_8_20_14_3_00_60_115]
METPTTVVAGAQPPPFLGQYRLLRRLGQGATSEVYLGYDPFEQREVAVKLFKQAFLDDPHHGRQNRKQLRNEAALAGKLNHPHIVRTFEAVINDENSYVVMEYVSGGTLEPFIHSDNLLPLDRVVEYLYQCCRALNYAQYHGVIHRDIKPANLLLAGMDGIKISDLGTAVRMDIEQTQSNAGSPNYMSPEQVRGESLTHLTDIYSLGVVMYRLLTGHSPYSPKNLAHLYQQILHDVPLSPSALRRDLPPPLERIVLRALQKNPADRFASWLELGNELAALGHFEKSDLEVAENEKFNILRKMKFFGDFGDIELWGILRIGEWQKQPEKTVLMRENEMSDAIYIIIEGSVSVTRGSRLLIALRNGDCCGEMAYIRGRQLPRSATVTANTEITVVKIDPHQLAQLSETCQSHFNQAFLYVLAERLRLADDRFSKLIS